VLKGERRRYSLALFADLDYLWRSWRVGIPPRAGMGALEMNPNLVDAFGVFERARSAAMATDEE